jgi:sugar lactone lactonase YvrE
LLCTFAFALLVAALAVPSLAAADAVIGTSGTGAGQVGNPRAVAVDQTEGLLYVSDSGNNRVNVFNATTGAFVRAFGWGVADGTTSALQVCTTSCFKGLSGSGSGQFSGMQGIAVDNNPASPAFHAVYVFDGGNNRVQRFTSAGAFVWMVGDGVNQTTNADLCTAASGNTCRAGTAGSGTGQINSVSSGGVAVGPGGTIYVADAVGSGATAKSRVQKFEPSGASAGQLLLEVAGGSGGQTGTAVDSGGNIYLSTNGANGAVRKYNPAGSEVFRRMPSFNVNGLAVDSADNFFVADNTDTSGIYQFDSSGTQLRTFYGNLKWRVPGLAPFNSGGNNIFTAEERGAEPTSGVRHIAFPPAGPVVHPSPTATVASPIGNTKATLKARINPEGKATTFHFEYITDDAFKAAGNSFGVGTVKSTETALPGSFTFAAAEVCREEFVASPSTKPDTCELRPAQTAVTGLSPETVYHFRAVASNADGSERAGPDTTFETKEPIEFGPLWSTDVGTQTATLHAELNPLGIAATARFEYVELSEFEATGFANAKEAPAPPADPIDVGEGETMVEISTDLAGLAQGTSYRYRVAATNRCKPEPAPLCEFAEVEGTFKTFAALEPTKTCSNNAFRAEGSGEFLPDCRGYEMVSPAEKLGGNIEPLLSISGYSAGLDQASLDGESITYSSYRAFADPASAPFIDQYLGRRGASGWTTEAISPKREDPALLTYLSLQLDRQYKGFTPDLCSGWVLQDARPILAPGAVEGFPGLYRRDNCGAETGSYKALSFPELPATEPPNLAPKKFSPDFQGSSADGSVSIFSVNDNLTSDAPAQPAACVNETSPSAEPCEARLYEARDSGTIKFVCILPNGSSNPNGCVGGGPAPGARFEGRFSNLSNAVSDDGSRIFWSSLTSGGNPAPDKLFVRVDGVETKEISSATDSRFRGASGDGSKVIYTVGQNLFEFDVDEEDTTTIAGNVMGVMGVSDDASRVIFVSSAVLTGAEQNSVGDAAVAGQPNLYLHTAGGGFKFVATLAVEDVSEVISPSSPIAFRPVARPSQVAATGQQAVFMSLASITGYDNIDAVTGKPDLEVFFYDSTANGGAGRIVCVSCNPSGARPEGQLLTQKLLEGWRAAGHIPTFESQLYAPRVISAGGDRVYFNSFESLVSRDTNGVEDAYQWQSAGSGSCTTASLTYQSSSSGCVDLISSGQSPQGSGFVDSSADGRDVFFKTYESLVGQDPGLRDIYDARVGGGFKGPVVTPPICEGEGCQIFNPAPVAVAPASRVAGPGNPKPHKCPKGKHKEKRKGKVRCVKNKPGKKKQSRGKGAGKSKGAGR